MRFNALHMVGGHPSIQGGGRYRGNCPFCGGERTFSSISEGNFLLFRCFRASCGAKGRVAKERSIFDCEKFQNDTYSQVAKAGRTINEYLFVVPDYWIRAEQNDKAYKFLHTYNCVPALGAGVVDVRYDPKLDRCVFLVLEQSLPVDAAGRSLSGQKPKWYRYGRSSSPFICPSYTIDYTTPAVVVEDCLSACAVYPAGYSGIALLGTSLTNDHIIKLSKFKNLIIALDKDASKKAVEFSATLGTYTKCRTVILKDDLKYYKPEEIRSILCRTK